MATRALVGFINDKPELISTYNHYDGYPESLGKGLEAHYSMPEEALKIASTGYISYLDPETGDIDSKYQEPADRTKLSTSFDEAMMEVAAKGDSYGADYIYIYNVENSDWAYASVSSVRGAAEQLRRSLIDLDGGVFGPSLDEGSRDNDVVEDTSVSVRDAEKALKGEHAPHVKMYIASLANDIRLNGDEAYEDYNEEDWQEDFREYIADKSELEESLKNRWQHRAGIKK